MAEDADQLDTIAEKVNRSKQLCDVAAWELKEFHMPYLRALIGNTESFKDLTVMAGEVTSAIEGATHKLQEMRALILLISSTTRNAGT